MYNTKHVCIYNTNTIFLPTDKVNENEKLFIMNVLYRQDILNIFDIEEFDEKIINTCVCELYEKVKANEVLNHLMTLLAKQFLTDDELTGLIIMYSFDFLYATHKCISQFLETGNILPEDLSELQKIITNSC
jgi:hypothetical protein